MFRLEEVLSSGRYGMVYKGVRLNDMRKVAIKKLPLRRADLDSFTNKDMIRREETHWRKATGNANVVSFYGKYEDDENMYFVSELCSYSLSDLASKTTVTPIESKRLIRDITRGVYWCHKLDIAHCDVKPANILIDDENFRWKLADFGNSQTAYHENDGLFFKRGTPSYSSPELFSTSSPYGKNVDMWAIGIITFQLHANWDHPFYNGTNNRDFIKSIQEGVPIWNGSFTNDVKDFISLCLEKDKDKRISSEEAIQHPYIK